MSVTTAFSAAPASRPAQSDIVKAVFIHYRQAPPSPVKPPEGSHGKPAPSAACPDPSTCTDYKWAGQKWATAPSVEVNYSGSGLSSSGVLAAVRAAFDAWSHYPGSELVASVTSDSTSCTSAGASSNDVNQVCWRDLTRSYPNAIAVTFIWYYRSNKQIVEADTVFNNGSGFAWSSTVQNSCDGYTLCNVDNGESGKYNVQDIGTHEFGHFLAFFGDLYTSRDAQLTMYGYGDTGELYKDSLAKGDCLAITAAYGGDCP